MSLRKQAQQVRSAGFRNSGQDSLLAHITPHEAGLLKLFGGSGRQDPRTGLPHFDDGGGEGPGGGFGGAGDGDYSGDFGGSPGAGGGSLGGFGDGSVDLGEGKLGNPGATANPGEMGYDGGNPGGSVGSDSIYSNEGINYGDASSLNASEDSPINTSPAQADESFWDSFLGKSLRGLVAAQLGPVGTIANMAYGLYNSKNPGATAVSNFGSTVGSTIGSSFGPAGSLAGGMAGSQFGKGVGNTGDASAAGNSRGGGGVENILGGLYGMYLGNQANNQSKTLSDMYGQNSPYASAMRQQLDRRDAAAGRRSQYGPREVELQAKLAGEYGRNFPNMMAAQQRTNQLRGQGLGMLFKAAQQYGLTDKIGQGLSSLFGGNGGGSSWGLEDGQHSAPNINDWGTEGMYGPGSGWGMDTVPQVEAPSVDFGEYF